MKSKRTKGQQGALFPSLSTAIVGKARAVSRVRFAAQKPRALDTALAFPKTTPEIKAKGRSSQRPRDEAFSRQDFNPSTPPVALAYCLQKMVLTNGATLRTTITTRSSHNNLYYLTIRCYYQRPQRKASKTNCLIWVPPEGAIAKSNVRADD